MQQPGFIIALLLLVTPAWAADVQKGEALYATCVACHGVDGAGNSALNSPSLAGQQGAYLERQLVHFKSGMRGADAKDTYGMQMRGMAATLVDDTAIADVVAYIGSLPPVALLLFATGVRDVDAQAPRDAVIEVRHGRWFNGTDFDDRTF